MATIRTGIELNDNFSNVLYSIINSVSLAVSSMDEMRQTMNANIDTSSLEGARNEINQATIAADELNAAMKGMSTPSVPTASSQAPEQAQWQTNNVDVFSGAGYERFQQEVQSANSMLQQLNSKQAQIQQTAASMDILPDSAIQDITGLGTRIQAVQQKIEQIESNSLDMGTDVANTQLEQLRMQLNQAIQEQNNLNAAMENMDVSAANAAYSKLSQSVANTERYIRDNTDSQGQFNNQIRDGTNNANNLTGAIKSAVSIYAILQGIKGTIGASDELTQTTARLNLMNDGLQTTQQLQDMIYLSAQKTHSSYLDTANAIAKMGNNAGGAFSGNEELIAFMEQVNKQFVIGGASTQEQSNAMMQLSQAMASGALRGDELNSILDAAPGIARTIEQSMGWAEGSIKSYAEEGAVTAQVVKNSLLNMADETNAAFDSMPLTFSQAMTDLGSATVRTFQPVLNRLNTIANSAAFKTFANNAVQAMAILANVVLNIFDLIGTVGGFIADNWSIVQPFIIGAAVALGIYTLALIANSVAQGINSLQKTFNTIAAYSNAKAVLANKAAFDAETIATAQATVAQASFNTVLMACPLTWILLIIIGVIAAFYAAVAAINKLTGSTHSATGIIVGILAMAVAFIWNLFLGLMDLVLGIINFWVNKFIIFANFFANVFENPISSVIYLFQGMADNVLGILESIARAMDKIFGSNMADAVSGWRSGLKDMADNVVSKYAPDENYQKVFDELNLSSESFGLERWSYGDAWDTGYDFGKKIDSAVSNFSLSDALGKTDIPQPDEYASALDSSNAASDIGNISSDTGDIKDSVSISEEQLKYLRDAAEQETINRFTTAEVKVDVGGITNHISSEMDLDGIVTGLTDAMSEAVNIAAEGIHN